MQHSTLATASSIGRPLDFAYPTNRVIVALTPLGALLGLLLVDGSSLRAIVAGAGSVLLGWALAREWAPDHPLSAFGASALSFLSLMFWPEPSLAGGFTALVLTRIVNRTVGPPATLVDTLVVAAATLYAAWALAAPALLLVAAVAWFLDRTLDPAGPRRHSFFGVLSLVGGAVGVLAALPDRPAAVPLWLGIPTIGLFSLAALRLRSVRTRSDQTGEKLSVGRVRAAMGLAVLFAASSYLPGGPDGSALGIVWATLVALLPVLLLSAFRRTS